MPRTEDENPEVPLVKSERTYEAPRLVAVGNLNDILAGIGTLQTDGGRGDPATGQIPP